MKRWTLLSVSMLALAVFAITCSTRTAPSSSGVPFVSDASASQGGTGTANATIQFGQPQGGSGVFPPGSHDHSFQANDKLVPQTVVIDKNGIVTFHTFGVHKIAIYDDGTEPEDINTALTKFHAAPCPNVPYVNDPNHRIFEVTAPPCAGGPATITHAFPDPGRFLVICEFLPHFADANMTGYVVVRNR